MSISQRFSGNEIWKCRRLDGNWDYLKLNEHIKECKKDPEKLATLKEVTGNYEFLIDSCQIFKDIEDDGKVFQLLKNIYSVAPKYEPELKILRRKDVPLLRQDPFIINCKCWVSYLYAQQIMAIDYYYDVWAREFFCSDIMFPDGGDLENRLFTILKEWRTNRPDQRVLKELKQMLNIVDRFRDPDNSGRKMAEKTTILQSSLHVIQKSSERIPVEFIELLIHFGSEFKGMDEWILHVSRTSLIKARRFMEMYSQFEKMYFGRKINIWATKWMDDEISFSPMRARINLRDTFGILKEKWEEEK